MATDSVADRGAANGLASGAARGAATAWPNADNGADARARTSRTRRQRDAANFKDIGARSVSQGRRPAKRRCETTRNQTFAGRLARDRRRDRTHRQKPARIERAKESGRCRGREGNRDRVSRVSRSASQLACSVTGHRHILHTLPTSPRRSCQGSGLQEYRSQFQGGQKTRGRLSEARAPRRAGDPQRRSD